MAYNDEIIRSEAAPLIPEEAYTEILATLPEYSTVMQLARRMPNLSRNQMRIPVSSSLATAYWRNPTDSGIAQTSDSAWENVYLNVEELTCIIPIPKTVLRDSEYDVWGQIKPDVMTAMGAAFDAAVFYGTNAPAAFPDDLLTACTAAGHVVSAAAFTDAYDAIMGDSGILTLIEQDGYMPTGHVGALSLKGKLRGLRSADGQPIFVANMADGVKQYLLDGERLQFPMNGGMDPAQSLMISGQWDQMVWGMRTDIEIDVSQDATIVDNNKAVQFALRQQGMVAMFATMRIGWARPNPINRINGNKVTRCPFGILTA